MTSAIPISDAGPRRWLQRHGRSPPAPAGPAAAGAAGRGAAGPRRPRRRPSPARYLEYARAVGRLGVGPSRGEPRAMAARQFDPDSPFGYRPPGGLLETALVYAYLFEKEGTPRYAERAREILLDLRRLPVGVPGLGREEAPRLRPRRARPARLLRRDALPARLRRAAPPRQALAGRGDADRGDGRRTRIDYLLQTSEWGTMNRTMLRAESLAWAVRALPNHPRAAVWEKQRRALGDDNWGNWEIEDATIYHGVWLYALLGYADALGKLDDLFKTPEVYYYAHYFLNLMSPGERRARLRRRRVDAELAALLRVLRGGGRPPQRPDDGVGRAADRDAVHRLLDAQQRRPGLLPARQLPMGPRRHPAGGADGPQRRGDGGRAGQEDRLPQRLGALVDVPPAQLPGRGRRRHELPRLPARFDPGRGREDDARPRRREQHRRC